MSLHNADYLGCEAGSPCFGTGSLACHKGSWAFTRVVCKRVPSSKAVPSVLQEIHIYASDAITVPCFLRLFGVLALAEDCSLNPRDQEQCSLCNPLIFTL